jgi:hypothetical protein
MDPDRHGQRRKVGFMWIREAGIPVPGNTRLLAQNEGLSILDVTLLSSSEIWRVVLYFDIIFEGNHSC